MKIATYLLIFLCLFSLQHSSLSHAQNSSDYPLGDEEGSSAELKAWENRFSNALLDSGKPVLALSAVNWIIQYGSTKSHEKAAQQLEKELSTLSNKLPDVLAAFHACKNKKLAVYCANVDFEFLFEEIDPQNLIYLIDNLKVSDTDQQLSTLSRMADKSSAKTYFNLFSYDIYAFAIRYLKNDPYPEMDYSYDTDDIEDLEVMQHQTNELKTAESINVLTESIYNQHYSEEYTLLEYKNIFTAQNITFSYVWSIQFPAFRPLMQSCEDTKRFHLCQKIATILISNGDTLMMNYMGYGLQEKILTAQLRINELKDSIISTTKLEKYSQCFYQAMHSAEQMNLLFHPILMTSQLKSYQKGSSELKSIRKSVYDFYHDMEKRKISVTFDPYDCEDIIRMDNSAFLKIYGKQAPLNRKLAKVH